MFVRPVPGRRVRWPKTMRLLDEKGAEVPFCEFWMTCIRNGDVEMVDPPPDGNLSSGSVSTENTTEINDGAKVFATSEAEATSSVSDDLAPASTNEIKPKKGSGS